MDQKPATVQGIVLSQQQYTRGHPRRPSAGINPTTPPPLPAPIIGVPAAVTRTVTVRRYPVAGISRSPSRATVTVTVSRSVTVSGRGVAVTVTVSRAVVVVVAVHVVGMKTVVAAGQLVDDLMVLQLLLLLLRLDVGVGRYVVIVEIGRRCNVSVVVVVVAAAAAVIGEQTQTQTPLNQSKSVERIFNL
ncbi:hypothetical protein FN846DRAFT_929245 [Sphaerosporella brunnea]|uniref:Uncharacterized protein n=1 Tax=Sphaerosporella brunnea TaxID=1250544 RepID=A0A5J5F922_9PEZI|nr:hypothetical protein FN846DRAFT_929245 [Sphaerosporella brunnea]